MKTISKMFASVCCTTILFSGLAREARADAWNKKTVITITEPLQVPKVLLQPGKYVFKLADSQSDRHIVQIFNADESKIITTILAIPNHRLRVRGKTEFGFWETPAGQPRALRAWFYPGDNFGQEFAYPKSMSMQIAAYSKETVQSYADTDSDLKTTKIEETTTVERTAVEPVPEPVVEQKTEENTVIAQNTQPAREPAPVVEQTTQEDRTVVQQADQAPTSLPQTASNYPLIALIGLLSLGAFAVMARPSHSAKR